MIWPSYIFNNLLTYFILIYHFFWLFLTNMASKHPFQPYVNHHIRNSTYVDLSYPFYPFYVQLSWIVGYAMRCLKIWAVIGRHGSWKLSCLGSLWSEKVYSTGVQTLDCINVPQYNWSKHSGWVYVPSSCTAVYCCVQRSTIHLYK